MKNSRRESHEWAGESWRRERQERAGEGKGRRGLAKGKAGEGWRRERQYSFCRLVEGVPTDTAAVEITHAYIIKQWQVQAY